MTRRDLAVFVGLVLGVPAITLGWIIGTLIGGVLS